MRTKVAVLASGRGSGFKAIAEAVRVGSLDAEIVALVSDKADAPALSLAREAGVRAIYVPLPSPGTQRREQHEEKILEALAPLNPQFLVLAGYMRVLTPKLIEAYRSERGYTRIVNVHPSLLPSFPGVNAYAQAFNQGVKVTGATVHLVELEVDSGPICAQQSFPIDDCTTVEQVEARGQKVEHELYPRALQWILRENFEFKPHAKPSAKRGDPTFPGEGKLGGHVIVPSPQAKGRGDI